MFHDVVMVKSRRVEHAEDTRAAILEAARALFAEQGYVASGIDEIAQRARMTKGAVYHHFTNKQDLFRAVVEGLYRDAIERLAQTSGERRLPTSPGGRNDLWDQVCGGYLAFLDLVCSDPAFQRIVYQDAPAVLGHEQLGEIAIGPADTMLHPILREAVDAGLIPPLAIETLSHLLGALIGRASFEIAHADDKRRAREEVGEVLDSLLQGLRQRT